MGISYLEKQKLFKLDTPNTTYMIGIVDAEGFLGHVYYGRRIQEAQGAEEFLRTLEGPFTPEKNSRDRSSFMDCFPWE